MNFETLPLLAFTSNLYDISLENVAVIACQHLLGTTENLFEELYSRGLKPENVYLIGKCYSTNDEVFTRFKERGVNISDYSSSFDSHISFDEQFQLYVDTFIKDIKVDLSTFKGVVILDDGAQLILYVNDFFKNFSSIVGVEQTSSGYTKLKDVNLNFPVVNIARSKAKLEIESSLIAELITARVEGYIKESENNSPKILVVGQGPIGMSITELLRKKYFVSGCDIINNKCDFSGDYKSHLNEFDIIIGATGQTIINPGDFGELKNGVTLISASSSDREFSASYFRKLIPQNTDCHSNIRVNGINLLNSGFPINFDGAVHSLLPEDAQLTRSLLFAGVCQALETKENQGLVDLDSMVQNKIIKEFKTYNENY